MQDINSLPTVPHHMVEAMQREAEKKFGKIQGLEEMQPQPQINPVLQYHEEAQSIDFPENVESESEVSGEMEETVAVNSESYIKKANDSEREHIAKSREANFTEMRIRAARAEKERDEAIRRLRDITEQQNNAPKSAPEYSDPVPGLGINPDDLVEGKHLNKFASKIEYLERQLQQNQQQSYQSAMESKLKAQYPDLERVLSADNIETFKMAYPELAASVAATSDYYNKAVSAYTMIKKFGIHQEENNVLEKQAIQKNIAKPKPLASVSPQQGDSPMSRANAFANGLTSDLKEQLRKEMEQARRGY